MHDYSTENRPASPVAAVVILLALLAIMACFGCQLPGGEHPSTGATAKGGSDLGVPNGPGYGFTDVDRAEVAPNLMHAVHAKDNRTQCTDCHTTDRVIPDTEAHKYCVECHGDAEVADPVWQNHCLSCHQFTEEAANYAKDNGILHELCQECHDGEQVVHHAFNADSSHDISCDNCHSPHETTLVFGGKVCLECHEDKAEATDESTRVHGSCLACHTPHSGIDEVEVYCTKCHYASQEIMIHNIPDHPKDCLACHKAHFSSTEIGDDSCLGCHDDTYYGGQSNLPEPHQDCENCHYTGNFAYRGDQVCADCHEHEGHVISEANLPTEHAHCSTCHTPHSWYSSFEATCDNCHDLTSVVEHNLSFHQHECHGCHDPHTTSTMTKTGHCSGCHTDPKYPDFKAGQIDEHLDCSNCHDQVAIDSRRFTFLGPAESCQVCHPFADPEMTTEWSDVPFGHQVCNMCHAAHKFDTKGHADSCDMCHVDIYESPPFMEHAECFNCHETGHTMDFTGQESSCELCHMDVVDGLGAIDAHPTDCDTCHTIHGELTASDACEMCHFELPGLHSFSMFFPDGTSNGCATCHNLHDMSAGNEGCAQCHDDDHTREEPQCMDCHSFREE